MQQPHQTPGLALHQPLHGGCAEAGREQTVEGAGLAATLNVPQDGEPRLEAEPLTMREEEGDEALAVPARPSATTMMACDFPRP